MRKYEEAKEELVNLYDLLDTVEQTGGKPDFVEMSLRDVFKTDVHTFLMYLSAADGKISAEERFFMNYLFDTSFSAHDYVKFINENNIYSTDFEETVPVTLQLLTEYDKKMQLAASLMGRELKPLTSIVLAFYLRVGTSFIECDGTEQNETDELRHYVEKVLEGIKTRLQIDDSKDNSDVAFIGGKKGSSHNAIEKRTATKMKQYGPSIYKVGVDIPAGEYKVFTDARGYFGICSDANCDMIIRNENFSGQAYINISTGQFLELSRCYAVPIVEAPIYNAGGGVYEPGEYKVGIEIPAGEYRVTSLGGGRGYYGIEVPLSNGARHIVSNNSFQGSAYVSVQRGQILQLCRCAIRV